MNNKIIGFAFFIAIIIGLIFYFKPYQKIYYSVSTISTEKNIVNNKTVNTIYFNVNNFDGNNINSVNGNYSITFKETGNYILEHKLYYKYNNQWLEIKVNDDNTYTGYNKMGVSGKETYQYRLDITSSENITMNQDYMLKIGIKVNR